MSDTISPHILVIDDDPQIRALLSEYLTDNGLRVSVASSGDEMSKVLGEEAVDLIVLDLRLAGEDGLAIARSLHHQSSISIVMLTGVRDEADRVMGLELGADDYVTKPFSTRELLARIRAVMRRYRTSESLPEENPAVRAYHFAGWTLNVPLHTLKSPTGERVPISNGEFGLLVALLGRPQRVLSRDQLLDLSRLRSTDVYDRAVDVQILRLRRKIESNPAQPELIKTERGVGYRFCAAVTTMHSSAVQYAPNARSAHGTTPVPVRARVREPPEACL